MLAAASPHKGGRLLSSILALLWCALVLLLFVGRSNALRGHSGNSLAVLGLGIGSAYAFWFVGFRIWRRFARCLPPGGDPLELSLLEIGLGTAVAMIALFFAGIAGLFRPWSAWTVLTLALLGNHGAFLRAVRARLAGLASCERSPFLLALLALVLGMSLIECLAPVTAQDALVYHMALPAHYVGERGLVPPPGNFFAHFPQNVEMLFTFGLLLEGQGLAQWYHWMLSAAAVAAVAQIARQLHDRASGILAAAVFATIPTAIVVSSWAYVEMGVVFFTALSVLCFLRWSTKGDVPWMVLSAGFAGVAAGCKYTAGCQGLLVVAGVMAFGSAIRPEFRWRLKQASMAGAVIALVASPWWIKNIVHTGNPVYPFLYGIFGGKDWDQERATVLSMALASWGARGDLLDAVLLPWRLTMDGQLFSERNFAGVIGCAFLLSAPFLLISAGISRKHRILLSLCLGHFLFWMLTTWQVRFLLPALAIASSLAGATVPVVLQGRWFGMTAALFKIALVLNVSVAAIYFSCRNSLPVVLGLEREESYLKRQIPDYEVFHCIERELPEDSRILFAGLGNPGFLCKRKYHADAFFENRTLAALLKGSRDPDATRERMRERGFTHLLFKPDLVLDPRCRKSDIPLEDQRKLVEFLNSRCRLVKQAAGTTLYEIK